MNPGTAIFPRPRDWWLLALALCLLYGWCLGARGLNEPDEGRYASMAQAMARPGGDWWEPRMSGLGHYDKPPLVYWAAALALRAFGCNEWAARLPSLLGAALALAGLGWAAGRLHGARIAWWAVAVCGTSLQFWTLGRVLSPDMLLTGWCTLAVAAWAECRHRDGSWRWWFGSLFFWMLAWWTKATPALIPLAGLAAGVWLTGDRAGRRALRLTLLLPGILALGSPWYLAMLHRYPELRHFFFGRELAGRLAGHADGRRGSFFYYLPTCALGWLPWWPLAARAWWRERTALFADRPGEPARGWLRRVGVEGWIVGVGLLIFSLAGSKLPTYTLTLAPWAALGMARLALRLPSADARRPGKLLWPGLGFGLAALAGVTFLPQIYEARLGANSSLRPVCRLLRARGAARVDADRYWAGMEFYLPAAQVHYVVRTLDPTLIFPHPPNAQPLRDSHFRERASDPGLAPPRFIEPPLWPAAPVLPGYAPPAVAPGAWWLVHFRKQENTPFQPLLASPAGRAEIVETLRLGDFDLYRLAHAP